MVVIASEFKKEIFATQPSSQAISEKGKKHNIVCIGVTGHRRLKNVQFLQKSVKKALFMIEDILKIKMENTIFTYHVISPLAEGADRLVVKEAMEWHVLDSSNNFFLDVVLPLSKEDYIRDFESTESKDEFELLFCKAHSIVTLGTTTSRNIAYENVGRYVVDNCDFLIAIWNGKPASGQGGTGDIVEYARKINRPILWINSEIGSVKKENIEFFAKKY